MPSFVSTAITLIGVVLMSVLGSMIARRIGLEQWHVAGFTIGVLLCALAPTWELRQRLKTLEEKLRTLSKSQ